MKLSNYRFIWGFWNFLLLMRHSHGDATTRKLLQDLLKDYNVLERPTLNVSDHFVVKVGLTLLRIISVNEVENHIETKSWTHMEWRDANLRWDPAEYHDINLITIPSSRIWMPDIYVYNQVGNIFDTTHPTNVMVRHDGNASYTTPGVFKTICIMSARYYPFEEHTCEIKMGSWTLDSDEMDLDLLNEDGGDQSIFTTNSEWELLGFPGKRTALYYTIFEKPPVDLSYFIHIRRKGLPILYFAYSLNFVICSVLILSSLIPPSSGYKIALAMFAMLLSVGAIIHLNPVALGVDDIPCLVIYFMMLLLVSLAFLFTNVMTFSIFHQKGNLPPPMKTLMDKFLTIPILSRICPTRREIETLGGMETEMSPGRLRDNGTTVTGVDILPELSSRIDDLRYFLIKQLETDGFGIINDWKFLAMILDRMIFIFWTSFILLFCTVAFPSFPVPTITISHLK